MIIGQSRGQSLGESCFNVFIGFGVALFAQITIFPLFNINIPLQDNLMIAGAFTVVSIVRSYFVRRIFNYYHVRQHQKVVELQRLGIPWR